MCELGGPNAHERGRARAFVSHSSRDKGRFVVAFATALRADGVDAWLDQWEMSAGDSLVQRIFDEGIGRADWVVVVLSEHSVRSRWVREELDAGVVQRINRSCRLVPVLIDAVPVPVALQHLVWLQLSELGFDRLVSEVVRSAFGHDEKPALGDRPGYGRPAGRLGLQTDPVDDVVLGLIIDALRSAPLNIVMFTNEIQALAAQQGIAEDAFFESLHALTTGRALDAEPMTGGQQWWIRGVPARVWLDAESKAGLDIAALRIRLLATLINQGQEAVGDPSEYLNVYPRTALALLEALQVEGLLRFVKDVNGRIRVTHMSPVAGRHLRSQ